MNLVVLEQERLKKNRSDDLTEPCGNNARRPGHLLMSLPAEKADLVKRNILEFCCGPSFQIADEMPK